MWMLKSSILFIHVLAMMSRLDTVFAQDVNMTDHQDAEFCFRGQHLDVSTMTCKDCPYDHFMPDPIHTQLRCYPCQHARENSGEKVLQKCTPVFDTVIGCVDGLYLKLAAVYDTNLVKCYPCSNCNETSPPSFQIRPCGKSVDTVCCPDPKSVAVPVDGAPAYTCQNPEPSSTEPLPEADVSTTDSERIEEQFSSAREHDTGYLNRDVEPLRSSSLEMHGNSENENERENERDSDRLLCGSDKFVKVDVITKTEGCAACPEGYQMPEKHHFNTRCLPSGRSSPDSDVSVQKTKSGYLLWYILVTCISVVFLSTFLAGLVVYRCLSKKPRTKNGKFRVKLIPTGV